MKETLFTVIISAVLLLCLTVGASAAYFGSGAAVMANEVTMIKTGLLGQSLKFSDTDFREALAIRNFDKVTITSLPSSADGELMLGSRRISEGQTIRRRNIASMEFIPASADVTEASFEFKVDGYASGESMKCYLKFIEKVNYAPTVEGVTEEALSFTTQRDISVYGKMSASDKEGDELEFIIVSYPENGTITQSGEDGASFRYTPSDGYSGKDSFVYVARDEYGNFSKTAKVTLKVTERLSEVVYVDMTELPSYNASVAMTGMGIMSGKRIGDDMYFMPDESVSRAEFVAMAMKAIGMSADKTLDASFFDDNSEIPASLVGYVATAQKRGIINGAFEDGELKFRPNDAITKYEAGIVMANLIELSDVSASLGTADVSSVPVWARGHWGAMHSIGIFNSEDGGARDAVTRAEASQYLYNLSLHQAK